MYENEEQARNAMNELNKKGFHVSFAKVIIINRNTYYNHN